MLKIAGFAVVSCVVCMFLRQQNKEFSVIAELFAACGAAVMIIPEIVALIGFAEEFFDDSGIEREYFSIGIKVLGIALLTQFTSDTCTDAGQSALAGKVELAGKTLMLTAAVPVIKAVLELAVGLIKS